MLATVLGAGALAASIGLMGTSAWLISRAAQHPSESSLALAIAAVQFFGLSRGILRYGERLVGHDAAFRQLAALRVRVWEQLDRLAPAGIPRFRRGDLLTRVVADVDAIQDLMLRVVPAFAMAGLVGALTVAVDWAILPAAGLVLAVSLLLAAVLVPWLTGWLANRTESGQAAVRGDLSAAVVDLVEGAPELLVYGAAQGQVDQVRAADSELTRIASTAAGTSGVGVALTTLLAGTAMWGALVFGVSATHAGRLSGVFLAVLTLIPLAAFELVVGLPAATQALPRVRRAAARVFAIADAPSPVVEPAAPRPVPAPPFDLQLSGVRAQYPGRDTVALDGVDLALPPGRRVAVVGPSGAGKSTLAAALLGFLSHDGTIALNGVEITMLRGDDLRSVVGLVADDAHVFDTTLAENIRLARRSATDEDLVAVLHRVGLGEWLDGLPDRLATGVGAFGTRLSGGQRRRLAVARALLADFPILVLDEPAEHLEPSAADALVADVLRLSVGRTTVLTTHRLAGLEAVDEVLVLDHGRVIERGRHGDLLHAGGWYAQRWREERAADSLMLVRSLP